MPTERIPLVGIHTTRSIDGQTVITASKDQRFLNCVFQLVRNPVTGKSIINVEKRPGWGVLSLVEAGSVSTGLIKTDFSGTVVSAFGATNSTLYDGTTSIGAITGKALLFSETALSGIGYVLIKSSDGTGWYYASNAKATLTYTGDTHTNTTIDGISDTTGMYAGQLVAGSGIVVGTRIASVTNGTTIVLDTATSATASGVTITKTPIAKIADTDFVTSGTTVTGFVELDGYVFYANADGFLYGSDLNSITAYTSTNKIAANMHPDTPLAVFKHKNLIGVSGAKSTEFFYNAGNPSGSPLSRAEQHFKLVGIQQQRSLHRLGDDIYWATSASEGDIRVVRLRDMSIMTVSTPEVSKMLGTASPFSSDIHISGFYLNGYPLVAAIVFSAAATANGFLLQENNDYLLLESGDKIIIDVDATSSTGISRNLVYNVDLNLWTEWSSTVMTYIRGGGTSSLNQIITSSRLDTGGKIYQINPSGDGAIYADDGTAYDTQIRTAQLDFGTRRRKFVDSVGLVGDIQSSGSVTLEASDDDYQTWETLGTFDLSENEPIITRCGSHEGYRAYRLTHSAASAFRAQALDVTYRLGAI